MLSLSRILVALYLIFLDSSAHANSDRVALVIGNGRYLHTAQLANPPNDANEIAIALRRLDFDVLERIDVNQEELSHVVDAFSEKARKSRIALVFYAGHGMQIDGRNFIIPVDLKIVDGVRFDQQTLELDSLIERVSSASRATIIVLDACRNNPMVKALRSLAPSRSATVRDGLAPYTPKVVAIQSAGTGVLIAFSTSPGTVALDGAGSNSPFTLALLRYLEQPGLEIRQMLTRVRSDVAASTSSKQIPWDNSSLFGDIYLAGQPAIAAKSPEPEKPKNCFTFNGQEFCN